MNRANNDQQRTETKVKNRRFLCRDVVDSTELVQPPSPYEDILPHFWTRFSARR